jgi:SAM-dependent methyltransferase
MEAAPASGAAQRAKPSFKARLKAWWEGYDLSEGSLPQDAGREAAASAAPGEPGAPPLPFLDRPATKVAQQLWGEGFNQPGGADFILTLVKPFALDPSMTVMDFGAGLGGGTRAVADEFGVWVHGFEGDVECAEGAQELSSRKGAKKAEIKPYRPQDFQPKPASYDCIFSHTALYRMAEKEKLLTLLERAMKPRGQCSITDFVRAPGVAADDPRLKDFPAVSGDGNSFWPTEDYAKLFRSLKIDVRIDEDQTANYRAAIIEAWVNFTNDSAGLACAKACPEEAVAEVALWTRRVAALDSGALQLRRYYGIKMGGSKI